MKKIKQINVIFVFLLICIEPAFATGSMDMVCENIDERVLVVTVPCVGDSSNGSIPSKSTDEFGTYHSTAKGDHKIPVTITKAIKGWELHHVEVAPGDSPTTEAADIDITQNGISLLGANGINGVGLIDTTSKGTTCTFGTLDMNMTVPIHSALVLNLTGMSAGSNCTVKLIFKKVTQ